MPCKRRHKAPGADAKSSHGHERHSLFHRVKTAERRNLSYRHDGLHSSVEGLGSSERFARMATFVMVPQITHNACDRIVNG
jgi:hypothetical protein